MAYPPLPDTELCWLTAPPLGSATYGNVGAEARCRSRPPCRPRPARRPACRSARRPRAPAARCRRRRRSGGGRSGSPAGRRRARRAGWAARSTGTRQVEPQHLRRLELGSAFDVGVVQLRVEVGLDRPVGLGGDAGQEDLDQVVARRRPAPARRRSPRSACGTSGSVTRSTTAGIVGVLVRARAR